MSPFYTVTDDDSQKYKDMVMKSGVPYCREIKTKRGDKSSGSKDTTVCYKCKNPKNGATYEQCSYHSQPLTDSSNIEDIPVAPPGFRSRRSNMDEASSGSRDSGDYGRHDSPYRFSERIFSDAADDVSPEYKNENEKCEKVAKDSMVCMVCRDTRSNAKYEQCSYVGKPGEKEQHAYAESGSPKTRSEKEDEEDVGKRSGREYSKSDEPVKEYSGYDDKEEPERSSREEAKESSNTCKKVQRGPKTCTVCKDPGTGGNYERCSYSYEPDDKVYKYSRSKSFGYPSKDNDNKKDYKEDKSLEEESRSEPEDYSKDYTIPEVYHEIQSSPPSSYFKDDESRSSHGHYGSSERSKSPTDEDPSSSSYEKSKLESQRVAESIEPSHCKEIERDSMTCKVCKDPKTGSNSEQCSYKYQPNDKSYSYSKSKSFGSPTEPEERSSYDGSEKQESKEPYESRGYDSSSEKTPRTRVANRGARREFSASGEGSSAPKKSDSGFYDAFKKKAEIQEVLREFQKEDRSNCKKLMRGKMTCYQCVDEKGFQKEECAFVTSDEPIGEKSDDREARERHLDEPTKKVPRSVEDRSYDSFAEPEAAASERAEREQSNSERSSDEVEKEPKEVEPYEYVAETRPVFDKVLGFTLPAYMLSTSEHEDEFDKIFTGSST
ncbi:hypothetical protein K0M31_020226 [Melipona bicolor]|uniref:Uncharacterized protein n=1 Tax=Melipona bicolor TaxID=60889 RepID=A0AA40G116_9HYME|nr:hypothetical protein K0M31_020226 [Melipona bicolor]